MTSCILRPAQARTNILETNGNYHGVPWVAPNTPDSEVKIKRQNHRLERSFLVVVTIPSHTEIAANGLIITLPIAFACFGKMHQLWDKARHHNYQVDYILLDVTVNNWMIYYYLISPCFCSITSFFHVNDECHIGMFDASNSSLAPPIFLCQVPAGPILTPQATRRSPDDHLKPWGTWKMVFTCGWFAGKILNQIIQLISLWFVLLICFFRIGPMVGWSLYPEITAFRVLNRGVAVRPIINL